MRFFSNTNECSRTHQVAKDQIFQPRLGHEMFLSGHPWAFIDYCRWMKVMLSRGMICQYGSPSRENERKWPEKRPFQNKRSLTTIIFIRGYVSFRGVVKNPYVCCPIADFWGGATQPSLVGLFPMDRFNFQFAQTLLPFNPPSHPGFQ